MRKGFWILIIILLFAASAYVYKLNLDKQETISDENNETNLFENLDKVENNYFWIFGIIVVIIVFFVAFSFIRKKSYY